jgi:hypothetical protein
MQNPVNSKKHYRLYVIYRIPTLRVLDFQRVRQKEREQATRLFKGKKGQQLAAKVGKKSKTFTPGEALFEKQAAPGGPSKEDIEAIKVDFSLIFNLHQMLVATVLCCFSVCVCVCLFVCYVVVAYYLSLMLFFFFL